MRILCVSDEVDPIIYSPRVKEHFPDIDLVISAGDLPMEYLGFLASMFNKPVLFVFGNHNLKYLGLFRPSIPIPFSAQPVPPHKFGATYISDRVLKVKGLLIAGLGGSYRYNNGLNQYSDFQMWLKVLRLVPRLLYNRIRYGRFLDILVTHAPPYGINDRPDPCHRGFKSFLWLLKTFKPRYHLHGHIHLYNGLEKRESRYQQTTVINVFKYYLLEPSL
ncbi:metallophosphoesterase [Spirochaeta thermophila DSM 6578]|uniref:Metallophosphoesterase n=1 Tax=Winmispira thermophila (strain ATCC 700085 / DSM 6578 / Z-1203) TaxID=869211 RepID=G0GAI8_WINT7|nr:metallophosphoesterase [Spirochaeta thermophila]AEJ60953.1 metallophosphoesterase [Spirochaeta thermophila DSM 6578]